MTKHKNNTAEEVFYNQESTAGKYERAITDPSVSKVSVDQLKSSLEEKDGKAIEAAVYAHIRAVRALGRTTINSAEIAGALSLPLQKVHEAISALRSKGVKAL